MRPLPLLLAALLAGTAALAEDRGVVITNFQSQDSAAAAQSGSAVAEAMKAAGFRAVSGSELKAADLREALSVLLQPDPEPGARMVVLNGRFLRSDRGGWFMGTDADTPNLLNADAQGISLSAVFDLLKTARPGAVLMLGETATELPAGEGLQGGLGDLSPPEGVTVVTGPAAAVGAGAVALLQPGTTLAQVLQAHPDLTLVPGGDPDLKLVAGPATADAAAPADPKADDRAVWADAAAEDTALAYRRYLDRFPQGAYSAAATARLNALDAQQTDRNLWADAAARNTPEAYRDYLNRYPQGEFAQAARKRLDELSPPAQPAPSPRAAQPSAPEIQQPRPVAPAPQASQAELAERRLGLSRGDRVVIQRRLNALGYSTGGTDGVFGSRTRSAIRGWQQRNGFAVTGYLTSTQVAEMRAQAGALTPSQEQQDRAYWQQTGAKGGVRNLRAYLDRYPDGIYANTARRRLAELQQDVVTPGEREDRAWARARQVDTVQAYDLYLQNWPRGEHAAQARARRSQLLNQGRVPVDPAIIGLEAIIRELSK